MFDYVALAALVGLAVLFAIGGVVWAVAGTVIAGYISGRFAELAVWQARERQRMEDSLEAFADWAERVLASGELPEHVQESVQEEYHLAQRILVQIRH